MFAMVNNKILKVLIVEDQKAIILFLKEILSKSKDRVYEIESAETISSALAKLDASDFNIILLDLNLPDSTNLETLGTINRKKPSIPIIVITGAYGNETGAMVIANGAQDYLVKGDFSGDTLEKSIDFAIERKNAAESSEKKERE